MPLPDRDFDVTEVAVPWHVLRRAGHEVVFATERGQAPPACDPRLLTGVLFGQLGAAPEPCAFYRELERDPAFLRPIAWDTDLTLYDGLLLAGGHAPGMRQYLGSSVLQGRVLDVFDAGLPVGAICHGVLVAARAGALQGRVTTCLCKYQEAIAYGLTFWKLGSYYRTYPTYVEDEVRARAGKFLRGPISLLKRDTATDSAPAFVVEDGNYVSARWPGDAYTFAARFLGRLEGSHGNLGT